jgi:hypothetical protein
VVRRTSRSGRRISAGGQKSVSGVCLNLRLTAAARWKTVNRGEYVCVEELSGGRASEAS